MMPKFTNKVSIIAVIFLFCLLLLTASFFKAGNLAETKMWLQLIAVTIFLLAAAFAPQLIKTPKLILFIIASYLLFSLLYLLPIPYDIWISLPGRERYIPVIDFLKLDELNHFSLTLITWESTKFFLGIIPAIVVFLISRNLNLLQLKLIFIVFIVTIIYQDLLGLIQYFSDASHFSEETAKLLNFIERGEVGHRGDAHGTYLNRDHYSSFLAMSISLLFAFFVLEIRKYYTDKGQLLKTLLLAFLLLLTLVAAIFSRSRAGISLSIFGLIVSIIVVASILSREEIPNRWLLLIPISSTLLIIVSPIVPVINRFIGLDPTEDGRVAMFENTIIAIKYFFPLGSGPGTFDEIYRNFQPIDQLRFINHAHNDYLELLMETGAIGIYVIISFFSLYFFYAYKLFSRLKYKITDYSYIKVASFIATLVFLLHGLVDFNFHTPANAIYFALFLGIFTNERLEFANSTRRHQ